ncbi:HtaA domain-containing protein [Streptomyces chartreusis]|uniref:HtaA domain-containing protein n=2 Tax=Streptomyces chartreusis TaxID=1969 RepID=UPI003405462C
MMTKRPGAAVVTGGALLALLCPAAGPAVAQDTEAFARTVSGGYATWTTTDAERRMSIDVTEPAVRGSADRASFPATSGSADPQTGAVDVELGGAARFAPAAGTVEPLTFGGLRLRVDDDEGALYARTAVDGRARELTLADVAAGAAGPVVRSGGVTWTGLRASLTEEGAKLLSAWSGDPFAWGDELGVFDVTLGTGAEPAAAEPSTPSSGSPTPSPDTATREQQEQQEQTRGDTPPTARVTTGAPTAGGERTVIGAGFEPGEVVLVAIDRDTRYQAVADDAGHVSRTFPVYATAAEGTHTVELTTVTGGRTAVAEFGVRANSPF